MTAQDPPRYVLEDGIGGQWLALEVNEHTCGTAVGGYYGAHEPGCGLEPIAPLADLLAAYESSRRPAIMDRAAAEGASPPHPLTQIGRTTRAPHTPTPHRLLSQIDPA